MNQPSTVEQPPEGQAQEERPREGRWWLWLLAAAGLTMTGKARVEAAQPWGVPLLVDALIALALLIVVLSQWRGRFVPRVLFVALGVGVVQGLRAALE